MSLVENSGVCLFPTQFIKNCIEKYTKSHGKKPKMLLISPEDHIDYTISCTLVPAESLGLEKIVIGHYLKSGEIDLAMELKNEKDDK